MDRLDKDLAKIPLDLRNAVKGLLGSLSAGRGRRMSESAKSVARTMLKGIGLKTPSWLGAGRNAPPPPPDRPFTPAADDEPPRRPRSPAGSPPRDGEDDGRGEVTLTPESSNVHSFWWIAGAQGDIGTLYVCYLAPSLNKSALSFDKETGHLRGKIGSTVKGKNRNPGATYAYARVPSLIYLGMRQAASKGKFVWDELRVRGTIHGHQYQYRLVSGAIAPSTGAPAGIYVPRKATAKGFRVRNVPVLGTGIRQSAGSTLPQRSFRVTGQRRGRAR